MKISISQMLESLEGLELLSKVKLPVKTSYWINRISTKVNAELKVFQEQRDILIKEFGEEKKDRKGIFEVKPENSEEYQKKVKELTAIEVELGFDKIKISDLGGIPIEPECMIDWVFTE
jgi:D-lyxose ketol-isomerase